ncbi:MAG: iron-sulfur cluster assembly accessory protein, partial [Cyanothece sp. SIO1E1]|nr:iron-sulfur cluster assembly accessory protein [Cyanothece sp. SIO1E1]
MIHLSQTAIQEILRLRTKHHHPQVIFRLGVQTGGCSDWLYTMGFDQTVQPEDQVYTCGGIQVVIDNR